MSRFFFSHADNSLARAGFGSELTAVVPIAFKREVHDEIFRKLKLDKACRNTHSLNT